MCGIVGAVAQRNIIDVLVEGLRRLEYRGYDSCGFAVVQNNALVRARTTERVADLAEQGKLLQGSLGIAHTRWATHGKPDTHNAHPHFSHDLIGLVHNGIIENYEELREELKSAGYQFVSQTDTEVIAHLIHHLYTHQAQQNLELAVRMALPRLHGAYAIAVICKDSPDLLVGARVGSPLVLAFGENENFLASDALAVAEHAKQMVYLEEGDVAVLSHSNVKITNAAGEILTREKKPVPEQAVAVDLGPYQHFMQKEIFEQPRAIADTISNVESVGAHLFGATEEQFNQLEGVLMLACGTSYYAASTAKYWIESIAKVPVQVEIASEYRYRDTVPNAKNLVVVVSQSGETADTLAALRHAKALGHTQSLAVCNVATSAMVRETKFAFLTHAGTEIGVASTKAFTTQLAGLYLLALSLAKVKKRLGLADEQLALHQLRHLPAAIHAVLALEPQIMAWSQSFAKCE
ncbi:MAG: hypothetical protein RIS03_387, partial [Pseudomonadota bacterium]